MIGSAMLSARLRSDLIVSPTCRNTSARPPTATLTVALSRVNSGDNVLMTSSTWSSLPVITPSTSACVWSLLASGGALPRLQYDATVLPSLSDNSWVIFVPPRR